MHRQANRWVAGSKSHEGNRLDAQGNHYGISECNAGFIYKFVPDRVVAIDFTQAAR